MKKILTLAAAACMSLSACATPAATTAPAASQSQRNPLGGLGNILGGNRDNNGGSSSIGNALGGLVGGLLSTDKITPESMVGTWNYSSPAVCFKSENFLQKAGGSAVAGTIENKLAPYYKTLGLNRLSLTVNDDKTFTMASGALKTHGTIEADGSGDVYFNFAALGKISLGKIKAYVTKSAGGNMSLMFDVSKLVTILKAVGSATGSSTVNTATSLLDSYDGICAGFKLKQQ